MTAGQALVFGLAAAIAASVFLAHWWRRAAALGRAISQREHDSRTRVISLPFDQVLAEFNAEIGGSGGVIRGAMDPLEPSELSADLPEHVARIFRTFRRVEIGAGDCYLDRSLLAPHPAWTNHVVIGRCGTIDVVADLTSGNIFLGSSRLAFPSVFHFLVAEARFTKILGEAFPPRREI